MQFAINKNSNHTYMIPVQPKKATRKETTRQLHRIRRKKITAEENFVRQSMFEGRLPIKGSHNQMKERLLVLKANDQAVRTVIDMLHRVTLIRKQMSPTWTRQNIIDRLHALSLLTRESESTHDLITRWLVAKVADDNFTKLSRLKPGTPPGSI